MKNATARKFFLHDHDQDADGRTACFFANGTDSASWGFWVSASGDVSVDSVSSSGKLPSAKIVEQCQRAAVAYLSK